MTLRDDPTRFRTSAKSATLQLGRVSPVASERNWMPTMPEIPETRAANVGLVATLSAVGRILLGMLTLAGGAAIAIVMAIATYHQLFTDDFFGVCVAAMVVVFGVMLVSIGFNLITDRKPRSADPHPLGEIRNLNKLVPPYLLYNHRRPR